MVVIIDIDDFKLINDMFGYKIGDKFLEVFFMLLKCYYCEDMVVCYGGEEFVVVLEWEYEQVMYIIILFM